MNPTPPPSTLPAPVLIGLQSLIPSMVRTGVLLIIGLAVRLGLGDALDSTTVELVLTFLLTMGYYAVIRVLETRWSKIGWLLGYGKAPAYVQGSVISADTVSTPPTTTTVIVTDQEPAPGPLED